MDMLQTDSKHKVEATTLRHFTSIAYSFIKVLFTIEMHLKDSAGSALTCIESQIE